MAGGDDLGLAELGSATLGAAGAVLMSRHHAKSRDICRFGAELEPSPTAQWPNRPPLCSPCGSFLADETATFWVDCVDSVSTVITAESELD